MRCLTYLFKKNLKVNSFSEHIGKEKEHINIVSHTSLECTARSLPVCQASWNLSRYKSSLPLEIRKALHPRYVFRSAISIVTSLYILVPK